jgi:hypothetical protein
MITTTVALQFLYENSFLQCPKLHKHVNIKISLFLDSRAITFLFDKKESRLDNIRLHHAKLILCNKIYIMKEFML